ncbi:H2A1 protein, partial [Urocolius indicus]|nr:H2A1 protein [Urocolius indicus]
WDPNNDSEGKATKSRSSRSSRAGLLFPVSRVERQLRSGCFARRLGAEAPVYLAAVLQCVTEEAVAVAGRIAKDRDDSCISALHLRTALRKSSVLKQLRRGNGPSHHARAGQERQCRALASRKKATKQKQATK